jgi:hypothetical protein
VLFLSFGAPRVNLRMKKLITFLLLNILITFSSEHLSVNLWKIVLVAKSKVAKRTGLAHPGSLLLAAFEIAGFIDCLHILQNLIQLRAIVLQL